MQINWYINFTGQSFQQVAPPRNWAELEIELLFVNDRPDMPYTEFPSATVQAANFEWVGSTADLLNKYQQQGLNGQSPGILEAIPIRIDFCIGSIVTSLNGYGIDLANDSTLFECDKVVAPLKKVGEIDFINDTADTISFANLYSSLTPTTNPGKIYWSDFVKIPYCITTIPNFTQLFTLGISTFLLAKELKESITKLGSDIAAFIADTTDATATSGLTAARVIGDIAIILLDIAYMVFILAALITMIFQIINNIYQFKKYKLGMQIETLFQKACASVGLNFKSSLLQGSGWTIMPKKIVMPAPSGNVLPTLFHRPADENVNNGYTYGYYEGTFKQLILDCQDYFNAAAKVVNGTLYFETVDFWNKQNAFKLPNTAPPGWTYNQPEPHGTNASKLPLNYFIQYQLDEQDQTTYDRYAGTSVQVKMLPKTVRVAQNQLGKGLRNVQLNFARATRKDWMSEVELYINTIISDFGKLGVFIIKAISKLVNLIHKGTIPSTSSLTSLSNSRIGWLELSQDYTGVPKIFKGVASTSPFPSPPNGGDWLIDPNNAGITSAIFLLQTYHGVNLATRGNQYFLYKNKKIPLCCTDFVTLTTNNILVTADNQKGKFSRILWNPHKETAFVDYGVQKNWTNNLTETIVIDGH